MRLNSCLLGLVIAACGSPADESAESSTTDADTSTGSSSSSAASTSSDTAGTSGGTESGGSTGMGAPDLPDPDTGDLPASDYCESIVDSFCDFYVRCGRMDVETGEACRDPFLETCNAVYEPQYVALEAAGLLSLSPDGLLACEGHLGNVACEVQTFELSGPCGAIWAGTQPSGGECGLDVEYYVCDSSAACTIGLDFCGTCETLLEPGDDCTVDGTTCGPEAFCAEGLCQARVANGDPCTELDRCMAGSACVDGTCEGPTFVGLGDSCDSANRCPYLTACVGGQCVPTARLGQACSATTPCEAGYCEGGACQSPQDDGAACSGNSQCSSGLCIESTCAPRPSPCVTP